MPHKRDAPETPTRLLARELLSEALGLLACHPVETIERQHAPGRGAPLLWTRQKMLGAIQAFVAREGSPPTSAQWREAGRHGLPGRATLRLVWQTPSEAIAEAGYVPPRPSADHHHGA